MGRGTREEKTLHGHLKAITMLSRIHILGWKPGGEKDNSLSPADDKLVIEERHETRNVYGQDELNYFSS